MIPQHIYQIGLQRAQYEHEWKILNPTFQYSLLGDAECWEVMRQTRNNRILDAYKRVLVGAMRADLCRLALMHVRGGVYVDSDVIPYKSLSQIWSENASLIASEYFSFELIISAPRHPFIGFALNRSVSRVHQEIENCNTHKRCCTGAHQCIIQVTGPGTYFQSMVEAGKYYGCANKRWVPNRISCSQSPFDTVKKIFRCTDTGMHHNPYKTTFCGIARHADCRNSGIGASCGQRHYKFKKKFFLYHSHSRSTFARADDGSALVG